MSNKYLVFGKKGTIEYPKGYNNKGLRQPLVSRKNETGAA
jgi:hypothetical protein